MVEKLSSDSLDDEKRREYWSRPLSVAIVNLCVWSVMSRNGALSNGTVQQEGSLSCLFHDQGPGTGRRFMI